MGYKIVMREGVKCVDMRTHRDYLGYTDEYSESDSTAASVVMDCQWVLDYTLPELGTPTHFYYATAVRLMKEVYRLRRVILRMQTDAAMGEKG